MSSSIVEALLSSSGIAYDGSNDRTVDTQIVARIFIKNDQGYFAVRIGERNAYGVDYGVIEIEAADACSYEACGNIMNDIEVGYVVMSESSYQPDKGHTVSEFAQLVIEHSKGTLTVKDSDEQSGMLVVGRQGN